MHNHEYKTLNIFFNFCSKQNIERTQIVTKIKYDSMFTCSIFVVEDCVWYLQFFYMVSQMALYNGLWVANIIIKSYVNFKLNCNYYLKW